MFTLQLRRYLFIEKTVVFWPYILERVKEIPQKFESPEDISTTARNYLAWNAGKPDKTDHYRSSWNDININSEILYINHDAGEVVYEDKENILFEIHKG